MRRKIIASFALMLLVAVIGVAHGDKKHVIGTVEKINSDSVVVKTNDGSSVTVKLVDSTVYVSHAASQDKPAKVSDLAVGDRVVIHATPNGETLSADEVKFSPAKSKQ